MDVADLVRLHPVVWHLADESALGSIREHGLLSTEALLDLYDVEPRLRSEIMGTVRPDSYRLTREGMGGATIRDNRPLRHLDACLSPASTRERFLRSLNDRVFLFATWSGLEALHARYAGDRHVVLHVDTAALVREHGDRVRLARVNTGATRTPPPWTPVRGHDSFIPVADYPYEEYRRIHHGKALSEVTVLGSVPDVLDLCVEVEHR